MSHRLTSIVAWGRGRGPRTGSRAARSPSRRVGAVLATVGVVVLGLAGSAGAHGGGAARGFTSSVTTIRPASSAIVVRILEGDDQVQLDARGHEVVIAGYQGEPYLWFGPSGVRQNERSPATYLNDERYGDVHVPDTADPDEPPVWRTVAEPGVAYAWHDHRIHWMSRSDPPVVVADPDSAHRIFEWTIPGTVDGERLAIDGRLDYAPPPGQEFPRLLLVPLVLLVLAAVAVGLWRGRGDADGGAARIEKAAGS